MAGRDAAWEEIRMAMVGEGEGLMPKRIAVPNLNRFCLEALTKVGLSLAHAEIIADVLVTTDTWGTFSHGTCALPKYLNVITSGGIDPAAVPEVISEGNGWAIVDGHSSMGMLSGSLAMNVAIQKARDSTVAWVGVRNSSHIGAAGYYAHLAARHDMIGIAMSNADPNMVVPGARGHVIGNNPLAYAIPAGEEQPILLDIALSAVAAGKIYALKAQGKSMPANWLTNAEGVPTAEIGDWPNSGSMMPMAGHKGYGIALLIEILSGVLTGASTLHEVKSWLFHPTESSGLGQAFIAINIGAIIPINAFKQRVDHVIREIQRSPKAENAERIYVPGEMEWEKREHALRYGIELPEEILSALGRLGIQLGLDSRLLD